MQPSNTQAKIPVTVLTGFLGAGKTTLLNRILTENHGLRIAVIENEFGEIGVDQELVINADEEIFEMNNGCICCTVRGDLIRILGNLMNRRDRFDRILIETTGMADPGPVAQTFFVDDETREEMSLDGIVTVVDAKHFSLHCDESDEVKSQIAFADVILLNKIDLVSTVELDDIEKRLRSMNGLAKVRRVRMADVPVNEVLDLGGFDLERALEVNPSFLEPEYPFEAAIGYQLTAGDHHLVLDAGPDPSMRVAMLAAESLDAAALIADAEAALRAYTQNPVTIAPLAGAISPGCHLWTLRLGGPGKQSFNVRVPKTGRYVFYTEHLPQEYALRLIDGSQREVAATVTHEFTAGHSHDEDVRSVSIEFEGAMNGDKINTWLGKLLKTRGADIFRMKGILDIAGETQRFVFQGVHMLFDGQAGGPWGEGRRSNRMVFIGRNLDRRELEESFRACLA